MKQAEFHITGSVPITLPLEERQMIERAIELHLDAAQVLVGLLDAADGDPDFCRSEHDGCEPDEDFEPSLGSLGSGWDCEAFNQAKWANGLGADLEDEHDGREPDVDDEPSLGWTISGDWGGSDDREQVQCED
jgi:hypothetical protein